MKAEGNLVLDVDIAVEITVGVEVEEEVSISFSWEDASDVNVADDEGTCNDICADSDIAVFR